MPLSQQAGYYCNVCDCILRDSQSYLDHINGEAAPIRCSVYSGSREAPGHKERSPASYCRCRAFSDPPALLLCP